MQLSTETFSKYILNFDVLKPILFLLFFIIAVLIVLYNWLYLSRTLHAHTQVGLNPPKHIDYLVKASSFLALFTAGLILIFLILGLSTN